jgi:hypothetical protein
VYLAAMERSLRIILAAGFSSGKYQLKDLQYILDFNIFPKRMKVSLKYAIDRTAVIVQTNKFCLKAIFKI